MASALERVRGLSCWSALGGALLFALLLGAPACGESASNPDPSSAGSSTAAGAGSGGAGTAAPTAGNAGSSSQGGSASSAGNNAVSGSSSGGKSSNGGPSTGGTASAAGNDSGGSGNEGGASGDLVDCDPMKITCKRASPECPAGQVPSVDDAGNCYGDCVKIDRCACSAANQCPDANQYTCWAKQHCGPYVQ